MFGKPKSTSSSKKNDSPKMNSPQNGGEGGGLDDMIQEIDMGQIDGMLRKEIRDDDITLNDDDMDDPELLSQLTQIESGGKLNRPAPPPKPVVVQQKTTVQTTTTVTQKKMMTTEEEEEAKLLAEFGDDMPTIGDEEDTQVMIEELKERKVSYQKSAMVFKNSGNTPQAIEMMKSAKALENAINELNEGIPVDYSLLPKSISNGAPQKPMVVQQQSPANTVSPRSVTPPSTTSPRSMSSSSGGSSFTSPASNFSSPPIKSPPKIETMSREKVEQEERAQIWELFEEEYKKKHVFLTSEALRVKSFDKHQAATLFKESKGIQAILDQIEKCKMADMTPPAYHFEERVTNTEMVHGHLKETELEVLIGKIELPKSVGAIDTFITGEFGYPTPEQPQKFQTATIGVAAGNFNYKTILQIERKKGLQRLLEKKKMTFTIGSSRMFFMKSIVGKCDVKLSDLLDKCEIIEKSPIMKEGSKKELGGYVEIIIRMKTPFNGKHLKKSVEKVLVLDGSLGISESTTITSTTVTTTTTATSTPSNTPSIESSPITTPAKQPQPQPQSQPLTPSSSTNNIKPTPTQTPTKSPSPAATADDDEDEDVEDLNKIVSNDVFESMLNNVNLQISQQGPKPDLLDKKQAIEIKMMVLETQVATGALTMEAYMKQLETSLTQDKLWAQKLVKEGKKDKAMKIMVRIKIMKNEFESNNEE